MKDGDVTLLVGRITIDIIDKVETKLNLNLSYELLLSIRHSN